MARITEYPEASAPDDNEVVLLDGAEGSKKITIENLFKPLKTAFQAGVDLIRDQLIREGVTPSSSTPEALAEGIDDACYLKYKEGQSTGRQEVGSHLSYQGGFGQGMSGSHNYTVDKDHYILICSILDVSSYSASITNVTGAEFISMINFNTNLSTVRGWREFRLYKTTATTVTVTKNGIPSDIFIVELGPCK